MRAALLGVAGRRRAAAPGDLERLVQGVYQKHVAPGVFPSLLTSLDAPPTSCAGAFENVVQALYKYVVPKPKADCTKPEQVGGQQLGVGQHQQGG